MESESPRPVLSYNELIIEAIKTSDVGMLSLQDIYDYIQDSYDYFKRTTVAWQNSIRHNLSVQKIFERVPRPSTMPGKGGLWRLAPVYEIETRSSDQIQADTFNHGVEKKRPGQGKRRRKRKYESDDESEQDDERNGEDDEEFGRYSMSNTPRKRVMPVKMPQSAPSFSSHPHRNSTRQKATGNHQNNTVESTGGTLVNSPFVTTSKLNPNEYQGNHLMDTLANIALSAEAHNYDWSSATSFSFGNNASAPPPPKWQNPSPSAILSIQLPPKKYHTQFRNNKLPPHAPSAPAGMMLNPLVGGQTLFQATAMKCASDSTDLSDF